MKKEVREERKEIIKACDREAMRLTIKKEFDRNIDYLHDLLDDYITFAYSIIDVTKSIIKVAYKTIEFVVLALVVRPVQLIYKIIGKRTGFTVWLKRNDLKNHFLEDHKVKALRADVKQYPMINNPDYTNKELRLFYYYVLQELRRRHREKLNSK